MVHNLKNLICSVKHNEYNLKHAVIDMPDCKFLLKQTSASQKNKKCVAVHKRFT